MVNSQWKILEKISGLFSKKNFKRLKKNKYLKVEKALCYILLKNDVNQHADVKTTAQGIVIFHDCC